MNIQERRKTPRKEGDLVEPVFIEIKHTFGPIRKSVYKVVEYNERGTSFLMPTKDGYFPTGQPLEYSLVKSDLTKEESYGVVKYYHPYNDHQGSSFFKVGLESNPFSSKPLLNYHIRPERLKVSELSSEHFIFFTINDKEFQFPLSDISRYSASFLCNEDDTMYFSVSSPINDVEIIFDSKTIFQGSVLVTRRSTVEDKYRIVFEPRGSTFNIDIIEKQETLSNVARSVNSLIATSSKYHSIDPLFKAIVADMRSFLESYRKILETPIASRLLLESEHAAYLDELNKTFYPEMDKYVEKLNTIVTSLNLTEQDDSLYKTYFQDHFHSLLMSAPFCHRMFFKPLGYPGDYEMMRMILEDGYHGPTMFAKLINKYVLQNPMAEANRNRVVFLSNYLAEFVRNCNSENVNILSIASGPALEIQRLIELFPDLANRIHITLLDHESEALKYSQDNIYMKRILNNCSIRVELFHQSIGSFLKQVSKRKISLPPFDLVYIFGLFDYFDNRACSFCMNNSASLLSNSGKMLISNYSLDGHHQRTYLEYAFEWYMIYRNKEQMIELANATKGVCSIKTYEDPTSVIKFLELDFGDKN